MKKNRCQTDRSEGINFNKHGWHAKIGLALTLCCQFTGDGSAAITEAKAAAANADAKPSCALLPHTAKAMGISAF